MYKKTIFIIILLAITSCATKKTTIQKEYINKVDTLIVTKDRIITERFTDTLTVENPCDSLGVLKPFKQSISVPQGEITIVSNNGNIEAEIDLKAYESLFESKYRTKYEEKQKELNVEIIRYKTPLWLIIYSALVTIICVLLLRFK